MYKKVLPVLLAVGMALSITACGAAGASNTGSTSAQQTQAAGETSETETKTAGSEKISFNATDINGNKLTDDDLKDAKLILVNYWEPWCGPCVEEMPSLQKLYEKYKDQGLEIVGVYSDDCQEDAEQIAKDDGITYHLVKCNDDLEKYAKNFVPLTYVLDKDGNIIPDSRVDGGQEYESWEQLVKEYLK